MGDAVKDKGGLLEPNQERLESNLRLLRLRSARAAEAVRAATVPSDLVLSLAADGGLTGTLGGRQLASLRAPLAEADKFAQSIDIATNAAVIIRGFGVGHHVAAVAKRLKQHGAVVVFEPDAGLLRAVMERLDCPWLMLANLAVVTDPDDTGAIAAAANGIEGILAAGTTLLDHPSSKTRLAGTAERFGTSFTNVMKAVRTGVVTTLVQVDVTLRNLLQNLAWYSTVPGVSDLAGACKGTPAIVVSAGPSLRRNVDLLSQPGIRDRVVIIAVQTVLKTLLARGIKPHFVTALDYHEISRRFYEELSAKDVEGVTLVVEPKCNRAILEAYPGAVRCVRDEVLDQVLGQGLARHMGAMPPGATVAHLAYYLARHLGCDPVILIGQDLGFTDGQYYAPGAAIHQVWSSELNEFNTLEMLEWQRIARMRTQLRKVLDTQGRTIYTDEQMSAYLVQFERDFMQDAARGLTTIDATEGGVLKKHTKVMTLRDALAAHANEAARVPGTPPALEGPLLKDQLDRVQSRLRELRQSTVRIASLGRDAEDVLAEMLAKQQDQQRVNALITRVGGMAARATGEAAYWLVQWLNQTGQFKRFRADRAIHIDPNLSPMEKQKREIERDLVNVRWLADSAEHLGRLLDEALGALVRGSMPTGKATAPKGTQTRPAGESGDTASNGKLWVAVHVDAEVGGLGTARDLAREFVAGMNPMQIMLSRLSRCARVAGVVLMSEDSDTARKLAGAAPAGLRVEFEHVDGAALRQRTRAVGAGRLWARHCWRGGLSNLSCYDEAVSVRTLAPVMERRGLDAVACVGADWSLVDPSLVDAVIARHLERPDGHELTFAHAPPGLGACVIRQKIVRELAVADSPIASIGGLIGFVPQAPQSDPIVKPVCINVDPSIRDLLVRCIPDSTERARGLADALGDQAVTATASQVAAALHSIESPSFGLEAVTLHASGAQKDTTLRTLATLGSETVINIVGGSLEESLRLSILAKSLGFAAVHVRTPLLGGVSHADLILATRPELVSIDVLAENSETYEALTGRACFDTVRDGVTRLLEARQIVQGMPTLWVVPRITRRDAVYEEVEPFYVRALVTAGAGVIDPLPATIPNERIEPLPVPANVLGRLRASTLVVDIDGVVRNGAGEIAEAWASPSQLKPLTRTAS